MKLAIISDLHLGFSYTTERKDDSFIQAQEAFEKAKPADAVLLAGDIFDSRVPSQDVLGRALQLFQILKGKPVVAIHGTHERRGKGLTNPVQLLEKAGLLKHLHCNSAILDVKGKKVAIHGMSGVPEKYARGVLEKWNPQPIKDALNIMMMHQAIEEYLYTGKDSPTLKLDDLPTGFDLIINGHIHWSEQKDNFLIPGSTIRTQLRKIEAEKPKGFYFYDGKNLNFQPLETPRKFFYTVIEFSDATPDKIVQEIRKALVEIKADKKPLARIVLKGSLQKGFSREDIGLSSIEREFEGQCIVRISKSGIETKSILERRELIEKLREKQLSVDELGLELLKKHLKDLSYTYVDSTEEMLGKLVKSEAESVYKMLETRRN